MTVDVPGVPTDESRRARYGDRLRREREECGLSQREAAGAVGVSQAAVSRVESGQESPEEVLVALEGLYGVPEPYPGAPRDPVRRMGWFAERNARLAGARPPASGVFGKGKVE